MKMTWANADGFQSASRDNLMMLEVDSFLGADGDASLGDFKERQKHAYQILSRVFANKDKKWEGYTQPFGSQIDAAKNSYKTSFPFNIKMSLDELINIRNKFNADKGIWENQKDQERSIINASSGGALLGGLVGSRIGGIGGAIVGSKVATISNEEVEIFRRSSKARANIEALNQLTKELDNVIKLKEEQLKAEAEKKLAEEKKKAAIEEAKKAPSTGSPVAGANADNVLGSLGGGSNKTLMYVGIGVAILVVGYFVTRNK